MQEFHDAEADEERDFELLVTAGIDEVWRFPGAALVRDVPSAMARFVLSHPDWFKASVGRAFKASGIDGAVLFAPVARDGYYEMPTPRNGQGGGMPSSRT